MRPSTSPGSACRPSSFLEKSSVPSTVTSNTPPDPSTSWTSAPGWNSLISASKLEARGP